MEVKLEIREWLVSPYLTIYKVIKEDNSDGVSNIIKYLDDTVGTCTNGLIESSTTWKPKHKEWCYFFDKANGQKSYKLSQFNHIAFGKGREGMFKDMQGNYYDSCTPFGASLECLIGELGLNFDNDILDFEESQKEAFECLNDLDKFNKLLDA